VPSLPSLSGEIIANAQAFMGSLGQVDVKNLSVNLNRLLVNVNDKVGSLPLEQLSADTQNVLRNANATIMRVDRLLADVKQSVDNVEVITGSLRGFADRGDLYRTITRIDQTVERLNGLMGDNQYDVRVIVQDLRTTAANLRALSTTIKQYPAGALIGGPPERVQLPAESSR
jgi:ABC-type transporter Mla subunit MlaD